METKLFVRNVPWRLEVPAVNRASPRSDENELQLRHDTNVCVWCRNSLFARRAHSLPAGPERTLISERILPRETPDGALVCFRCWIYARRLLQQQGIINATPVDINTCVWCFRSLARTRRHSLPAGPERNEIIARIYPREIPEHALLCATCWGQAHQNVQIDEGDRVQEPPADASHECSSRQSNTSTSQHAGAATRRTSSGATNDDDGADDAELFSDHSDDGSMDCIKPSTKTETSTEIKISSKTEMTTKTIAISAAEISVDEVFSCDVCSGSIVGFRYVCVQCAHYDLCGSCEARGEHSLHYVLRIPRDKLTAEVDAILSKIRTHLLYGLETEEAEQEADDRVVPTLPEEFEIKAEIKEDLPDPLENEDVIPDDHYTEPEYIVRESTLKEKTPTPAPVNTSSMILTETEGNYVNIENPVKSKATKIRPKTITHKNTTEPEHNGSEKRMKIYLEEQTQVIETMMDVPVDTAGPSTEEGASGLLPDIVKTAEEGEDSFQVFSHSPHKILEDKPGPDTGITKATSKKKEL